MASEIVTTRSLSLSEQRVATRDKRQSVQDEIVPILLKIPDLQAPITFDGLRQWYNEVSPDQMTKSADDLMKMRKDLKSRKDRLSGLRKTNDTMKEEEQQVYQLLDVVTHDKLQLQKVLESQLIEFLNQLRPHFEEARVKEVVSMAYKYPGIIPPDVIKNQRAKRRVSPYILTPASAQTSKRSKSSKSQRESVETQFHKETAHTPKQVDNIAITRLEEEKTLLHEQLKQTNLTLEEKQLDLLCARELGIPITEEEANEYSKVEVDTITLSVHQPDKLVLMIADHFDTLPTQPCQPYSEVYMRTLLKIVATCVKGEDHRYTQGLLDHIPWLQTRYKDIVNHQHIHLLYTLITSMFGYIELTGVSRSSCFIICANIISCGNIHMWEMILGGVRNNYFGDPSSWDVLDLVSFSWLLSVIPDNNIDVKQYISDLSIAKDCQRLSQALKGIPISDILHLLTRRCTLRLLRGYTNLYLFTHQGSNLMFILPIESSTEEVLRVYIWTKSDAGVVFSTQGVEIKVVVDHNGHRFIVRANQSQLQAPDFVFEMGKETDIESIEFLWRYFTEELISASSYASNRVQRTGNGNDDYEMDDKGNGVESDEEEEEYDSDVD